jgi:hypothetical protein
MRTDLVPSEQHILGWIEDVFGRGIRRPGSPADRWAEGWIEQRLRDLFDPHPTTDGGPFHLADVPLVNFLTAPFYLFDAIDTLDKIHRPSLVPVTRAAVRIVESTAGVSADAMRAGRGDRTGPAGSPAERSRRASRV